MARKRTRWAMPKRKTARWIKEGRGMGEGKLYKPWYRVQDVPSKGFLCRVFGSTTGRMHHLLSRLERNFFLIFDYLLFYTDIREQYPLLPLEETLEIAEECGIRHPVCRHSKDPIVLSTDFHLTVQTGAGSSVSVRTVKPAGELDNERKQRRILEKFEIERRYWLRRGLTMKILTEEHLPNGLFHNVNRIHRCRLLTDIDPLTADDVNRLETEMLPHIAEGRWPLSQITSASDRRFGLKAGTCLTVVYHLIATHRWRVDLSTVLRTSEKLIVSNLAELRAPGRKAVSR